MEGGGGKWIRMTTINIIIVLFGSKTYPVFMEKGGGEYKKDGLKM